jgi:hypothetical protein
VDFEGLENEAIKRLVSDAEHKGDGVAYFYIANSSHLASIPKEKQASPLTQVIMPKSKET